MAAKKAAYVVTVDPCEQVERAWLDAGRRGDTKTMQSLRETHPKWLALDRVVASEDRRDRDDDGESFCDWEKFHLPTVGASALHAAAWDGNDQVLEFLLKEGQKVDTKGGQGVTVLMATLMRHNVQALRAVFQGSAVVQLNTVVDCRKEDAERLEHTLRVVKLLLSHGADTEARDDEGKTALYLATNDEMFEVTKLLVERGARLDTQDSTGRSLLQACMQGSSGKSALVANLLISRGAPIDITDKAGETPMSVAVRHGDVGALQLLLNHPSLSDKAKQSDFASCMLLKAAEFGQIPVVRFLLDDSFTSIDVTNAKGESALHLAIMKQHKDLVQMLCAAKSTELLLKARTKDKSESVLHYAARYGSPQGLQLVLAMLGNASSKEINAVNAGGLTPLYLATTARTAGSTTDRRAKVAQFEKVGALLFPSGSRLFRDVESSSDVALVSTNAAVKRCLAMWVTECSASPMLSSTAIYDFCLNWVACVQRPQAAGKQEDGNVNAKVAVPLKQEATKAPAPVKEDTQQPPTAEQQAAASKTLAPEKQGAEQQPNVPAEKEAKEQPEPGAKPQVASQRVPLSKTLASLVYAGYAADSLPLLVTLPLKQAEVPHFLELLKKLSIDTKCSMLSKLQQELAGAWKSETDDRSQSVKPKAVE